MADEVEKKCKHERSKCVYEEYGGLSSGGDYERYECLDCGKRFWVELPD